MEDPNNLLPDSSSTEAGGLGALFGGLLSYAGAKVIDSKFPTGNTTAQNAAAQTAAAAAAAKANQATAPFNWKPYAIGGGIAAGVVLLAIILLKSSK